MTQTSQQSKSFIKMRVHDTVITTKTSTNDVVVAAGNQADSANLFLNYFTNFSRKTINPHTADIQPPEQSTSSMLKNFLDSKKNIGATAACVKNVSINSRLNANNNNNNSNVSKNRDEIKTHENSLNLVKSLVKKHESLKQRPNHITTTKDPVFTKNTSSHSNSFLQKAKVFQKQENSNCVFLNSMSTKMIRNNLEIIPANNLDSDMSNSLNLSPSSSSNSSSNSCCNSENFSDSNTSTNNSLRTQFTDTRNMMPEFLPALAFDNLTYTSSSDELDMDCELQSSACLNNRSPQRNENISDNSTKKQPLQQQQQTNANNNNFLVQNCNLKKNLKSIKRKDRLKKKTDESGIAMNQNINNLKIDSFSVAQSMPDLSIISQTPNKNQQINDSITNSEYEKRLRKKFRMKALSRSLRRAKSVYYCNIRSKSMEDLTAEEKSLFKAGSNMSLCFAQNTKLSRSSRLNSCNSSMESCISGLASDISSSYFHELSDWSPDFSSCESDSSKEDELFESIDWENNFSNLGLSDEEDTEENIIVFSKSLKENERASKSDENMHSDLFIKKFDSIKINEAFLKELNSLNNRECSICSCQMGINETVSLLDCDHLFHSTCIRTYFTKSSECPSCCKPDGDHNNKKRYITKLETLI